MAERTGGPVGGGQGARAALVVVATPIGNLGDLPPRAVAELAGADVVACEDTRRTGRLLELAGISAQRLMVLNDHTEVTAIPQVLAGLARGERIVIVTDAGTPGIADPGERLVAATVEAGHEVVVVPGASAVVAALVVSGLPTSRFVMEGFLPRKGSDRAARLAEVAAEQRTVVLFEAPHRMVRTVEDLRSVCGDHRRVALCRELTKLHEEVWRGTLADAVGSLAAEPPRGEFVVVLEGAPPPEGPTDDELRRLVREVVERGGSTRDAVDEVCAATGAAHRRVYRLALGD